MGFRFGQPWWMAAAAIVVPMVYLSWRNLAALGQVRRAAAVALRVAVVVLLAALLARPMLTQTHRKTTLIAVIDRSRSIPEELREPALAFLTEALGHKSAEDQLAVVDVAEAAAIAALPANQVEVPRRNVSLEGWLSDLASGVQMAMAIAPPDTAARILLVSDGNETAGDLSEAARVAAANHIPIDVLPLRYTYDREVVFRHLVCPTRARKGQTVPLRFVLSSTAEATGRLMLSLNGKPVQLDPGSDSPAAGISLKPGTNVKIISLPLTGSGLHHFQATFLPDDPSCDRVSANNQAAGVTFVSGPGHVLVIDEQGSAGDAVAKALADANVDVRRLLAGELSEDLTELMATDAIVLADVPNNSMTYRQQEMLCRYVTDLGGGLIMVGGPNSFGAGGWIGSPVARILPVDLDPPQKKQMPKGALVLIMHACEMPQGNYWGKQVAIAAVNVLSRLDLVGVLNYAWRGRDADWVYPLGPVGEKKAVVTAIQQMQMGDMPDFAAPMQAAYDKLKAAQAAQKHVIIISDGDPSPPSPALLGQMREEGITCTGVAVFPHSPADVRSLQQIAAATGGRFYDVKDPNSLPQIFIKEAQVVRRAMIVEETFPPTVTYSLSEIVRGLAGALPALDGYVLTGPRGGLSQLVLARDNGDPVLATGQFGLGRTVAFTSSADSRWAVRWLAWGGFGRFWEQAVRWAGKPGRAEDCEVFADVRGREVSLTIEAVDPAGKFVQFSGITAQVIAPDMTAREVGLNQVGPGRYRGNFQAGASGSYLVNLRYQKPGEEQAHATQSVVSVPYAPEFRDLTDNAAALAEVAAVTGGRQMAADPAKANLFDPSGLRFPQTARPLTKPLMLVWLAVFLLDVAARRIAVDFRALARGVVGLPGRFRRSATVEASLARLRARRKKVVEGFARQASRDPLAGRRYEGAAKSGTPRSGDLAGEGQGGEMPLADLKPSPEQPLAEKPAQPAPRGAEAEQTHLQRLLRAKRQARDRQAGQGDQEK